MMKPLEYDKTGLGLEKGGVSGGNRDALHIVVQCIATERPGTGLGCRSVKKGCGGIGLRGAGPGGRRLDGERT